MRRVAIPSAVCLVVSLAACQLPARTDAPPAKRASVSEPAGEPPASDATLGLPPPGRTSARPVAARPRARPAPRLVPGSPSAPASATVTTAVRDGLAAALTATDFALGALTAGEAGEASGPVRLFGHEGVLAATFDAARELRGVEVTLAGGTVAATDLDRVGGGGLGELLASVPGPVSLRRVSIVLAEGGGPAAVRVGLDAGGAWDVLPGGGARLEDVELELAVERSGGERRVSGSVWGSLALGRASLALVGTLGRRAEDLELSAAVADPLSLAGVVSDLAGPEAASALAPLPGVLKDAGLRSTSLALWPGKKGATLEADSELGRVALSAGRVRGKTCFLAAFAPPRGFKLGRLDGALSSLDAAEIDLSNVVLALSSAGGRTDFALGDAAPAGSPVSVGLNVFARIDLRPLKLERALRVDHLDLRASVPFPDPIRLRLQAMIQTTIDLGGGARFEEVSFELAPDPKRFRLALRGRVGLKVDRQTLAMTGEMAIEPLTQSAAVTLALDPAAGEWREPFGLKGVGVDKLAASLGATLGAGIPLPTIGLQGGLRLGDGSDPVRGAGVVVLNPRDPMHGIVALDLGKLALPRLLGLASPPAADRIRRTPLAGALEAVELDGVAVRIVPDDLDFAGVHFEKGYRVAGGFTILGAKARALFELDYDAGLRALATVSPIRLGQALEITGARGRPGPLLKLDLRTDSQELLVSGRVVLLKDLLGAGKPFFAGETDLRVLPDGFSLYSRGPALGIFEAELECTAKGSIRDRSPDFHLRARLEQKVLQEIARHARDEIDRATRKHVADIDAAKKKVARFEAEARRLDVKIAEERRKAEARRTRDIANMRAAAESTRRTAQAEYDRLGGVIRDREASIREAKSWRFPKSVGAPARIAQLGTEIGWLETRRNAQKLVLDGIAANLTKGLAGIGEKFPIELASVVGPLEVAKNAAIAEAKVAQVVLDGYKGVVKGTMGAAAWIAEHGIGGVLDLHLMQFETRLATQRDRFVAMQVAGKFLGSGFRTGLRLDLESPATVARDLAKALLDGARHGDFRDLEIARRAPASLPEPGTLPALTVAQLSAARSSR